AELAPSSRVDEPGPAEQRASRDQLNIVQVRHASGFDPLRLPKGHLSTETAHRRRHRGDEDSPEPGGHAPSGEHDNGPDVVQIRPPDVPMTEIARPFGTLARSSHARWRRRCKAS